MDQKTSSQGSRRGVCMLDCDCHGRSSGAAIAEIASESCGCPFHTEMSNSDTATSIRSPMQLPSDASFSFTLLSVDSGPLHFCVTPHMCTHSLYLRSARDVGASEGTVPVGSEQAIRDYVAYLQYREFQHQLAAELARPSAATGSPATVPPLPTVTPPVGAPQFEPSVCGSREKNVYHGMQSFLYPCDWDEVGSDAPCNYATQPLDCDRAYARHTNCLRHWYTASEWASFRREDTSEGAMRGGVDNDLDYMRSSVAVVASRAAAVDGVLASTSSPAGLFSDSLAPAADRDDEGGSARHQGSIPRRFSWMQSSSASSSSSLSFSVSTASLEAYLSAAQAPCASGSGLQDKDQCTHLGEQLGYGEFVALEDPACVFFVEHVLLAHEPTRSVPAALAAGVQRRSGPSLPVAEESGRGFISNSPQGDGSVLLETHQSSAPTTADSAVPFSSHSASVHTLTVRQQCRLLELISVADFMGTQTLVELCATYLATWLMDHTDEEIVQSFLTMPPWTGYIVRTGVPSAPDSLKLTGAVSFKDPWMVPVSMDAVLPAESSEAVKVSLPSAGLLSRSGTGESRTKSVAVSAAGKKRGSAARGHVGKCRENHPNPATTAAVVPSAHDGCGVDITTVAAVASSDGSREQKPLLSDEQRLALLRHMKLENSIMVSPY